jgi:hypothetical protein
MKKPDISIRTSNKVVSLDKYCGEWVAFTNGKVVAHEGTLKRLMKRVTKLKGDKKNPSVLLVPNKNEGPYVI